MSKLVKLGVSVGVVALVVVAGGVAMVSLQPGAIEIERSIEVAASPADVAPYASDLRRFNEWSPWEGIDPNVQTTYSESSTGVGTWYAWTGDDEVGEGKQTITVSEPGKVVHDLHFIRPFEDHATSTLTWTGSKGKTTISWAFHQEAGFMTKAANLAMDITGMLENDYQRGLDRMKPLVEAAASERAMAAAAAKAEAERLAAEAMAGNAAPPDGSR